MRKGLIFVLSAPAGTGKTTLLHMLLDEFPSILESISCTTRVPRPGEVEGKHYHFLSEEEFQKRVDEGDFLEYVEYMGARYGTSRQYVDEILDAGKHVMMIIDTQGAMEIRDKIDATYIFLSAPTREELRRRLEERKTESPEMIEKRLAWSDHEYTHIDQYDYHVVNESLEIAYQVLRSIVIAEGHRLERIKD